MTAAEWKNRVLAIARADAAGDPEPLRILSEQLAAGDSSREGLLAYIESLEEAATRPDLVVERTDSDSDEVDGDDVNETPDPTVDDA